MTDWLSEDHEASAGLTNMLVVLADNKYALGRRMAEWAVGPPTLEGSVAGAAIGQQMLGEARLLYPVLEQLPGAELYPPDEVSRRAYNMSVLDDQWQTWPQTVATMLLVNTACDVILESLAESAYEDLAVRVKRMLHDGRFQAQYAQGRVVELKDRYARGAELLQQQVDAVFPEVLAWFGTDDEAGVQAMVAANLVTGGGATWRKEWLDRVSSMLSAGEVTIPATRTDAGTWEHEEVPWNRWNTLQRRLESQPATTS